MNLSISNIGWSSENDEEMYKILNKNSFLGLEIAPTRIFPENPYDKKEEAKKWANKLKEEYNLVIPSMQSIWYGRKENIFESKEEREELVKYTQKAIEFANEIGCKNLVFGCPRNRNLAEGKNSDIALEFFKTLGDYAYELGTVIGMEANPTIYNTNYINDTLSALELIKNVNSKGFLLNLDLGTIIQNNEDINELKNQVEYINHVHISEPNLKIIEKRDLHKKLKDILISEKYKGFISIEMGKCDDIKIIEDTMEYIKEIFNK